MRGTEGMIAAKLASDVKPPAEMPIGPVGVSAGGCITDAGARCTASVFAFPPPES